MLNILQLKALVHFQALWWRSGGLLMWCVLDIGLFEGQLSVRPQSGFHLQHQCVESECGVAFSLSVTTHAHVLCYTVCPSGTALFSGRRKYSVSVDSVQVSSVSVHSNFPSVFYNHSILVPLQVFHFHEYYVKCYLFLFKAEFSATTTSVCCVMCSSFSFSFFFY